MIEAARRFYTERKGEDGWLEVVEQAYHDALVIRAEAERQKRMIRPDYGKLTPDDLLNRVAEGMGAKRGYEDNA